MNEVLEFIGLVIMLTLIKMVGWCIVVRIWIAAYEYGRRTR